MFSIIAIVLFVCLFACLCFFFLMVERFKHMNLWLTRFGNHFPQYQQLIPLCNCVISISVIYNPFIKYVCVALADLC